MLARHSRALFAFAFSVHALPSAADPAPPSSALDTALVDFASIPTGVLPPLPATDGAPASVPSFTQPADITLTAVGEVRPRGKGRPGMRVFKPSSRWVELRWATSALGAMYVAATDADAGEVRSSPRMSCSEREGVTPIRWEKLKLEPDGSAELEVRDMWFDAQSCAVGPESSSTTMLKAIAWEDGKPWLFAMRSELGVTVIMPRSNDVTTDAMVGQSTTVRGDFTRVTLPLGRWGSSSIVANLPALSFNPAAVAEDDPVEVNIELVQTMEERIPTVLVRTRRMSAESPPET